MISLRKYIDQQGDAAFRLALAAYCSALETFGSSGVEACPPVGTALRENLGNLKAALETEPTSAVLEETDQRVKTQLKNWGTNAAAYFRQRAGEVKELMLILARTAEVIGERDQRYSSHLEDFTGRLHTIADLEDLAEIRDSLLKSANDLKACAEAMAEESSEAVRQLRQDVNRCQAQLGDAERLAATDSLTCVHNRRSVEAAIAARIEQGRTFSVIVLDLNGFKRVNDMHGHLAGDEVLKQFAARLTSAFRSSDVVGRWGGDEFIVMLEGNPQEAIACVDRITRLVFGDYGIPIGNVIRKVSVDAAVGIASWRRGDTLRSLLERADAAMYSSKRGFASVRAVMRSFTA